MKIPQSMRVLHVPGARGRSRGGLRVKRLLNERDSAVTGLDSEARPDSRRDSVVGLLAMTRGGPLVMTALQWSASHSDLAECSYHGDRTGACLSCRARRSDALRHYSSSKQMEAGGKQQRHSPPNPEIGFKHKDTKTQEFGPGRLDESHQTGGSVSQPEVTIPMASLAVQSRIRVAEMA